MSSDSDPAFKEGRSSMTEGAQSRPDSNCSAESNPTPRHYLAAGLKVVLGMIAVVIIIGWLENSCSSSSSSPIAESDSATDAPTHAPAEDLRAKREVAQKYWSGALTELAFAGAAIAIAAKDEENGDTVSAQQILTLAEQRAGAAYDKASNDEPPGDAWMHIQDLLMDSASTYKQTIQEYKDGLSEGNSEKLAAALDDAAKVGESISEATEQARQWYVQNGGRASDVEDFSTAEKDTEALFNSALQGSQN